MGITNVKRRKQKASFGKLEIYQGDPDQFCHRITTMDETCIHNFDSNKRKKDKACLGNDHAGKVMASVSWDSERIVIIDYLPKGQTIGDLTPSLLCRFLC